MSLNLKTSTNPSSLRFANVVLVYFLYSVVVQNCFAQNTSCSFDFKTYYFASSTGTSEESKKQAITRLYRTIFEDFKGRLDQATFNRILTKCGIVRTCIAPNNQTTAYVLRSACRNCFTCQPNIKVTILGMSDNEVQSKIQLNTMDFFNELYCGVEQNSSLKFNKFQVNGETKTVLTKLWELNPIKFPDFTLSGKATPVNFGYIMENIPVSFQKAEFPNDNIAITFDKTGTIIDISFMTKSQSVSNKLEKDLISSINIFLSNLRTAYLIKDSSMVFKLLKGENPSNFTPSQKEYIKFLKNVFSERTFSNFLFDKIELCPLINDEALIGVSINQSVYRLGKFEDIGYLTLFLEAKNKGKEFLINNFKISMNKLDPCFP